MSPLQVWFEAFKIRLQSCPRQHIDSLAHDADAVTVEYARRTPNYFNNLFNEKLADSTSAADSRAAHSWRSKGSRAAQSEQKP